MLKFFRRTLVADVPPVIKFLLVASWNMEVCMGVRASLQLFPEFLLGFLHLWIALGYEWQIHFLKDQMSSLKVVGSSDPISPSLFMFKGSTRHFLAPLVYLIMANTHSEVRSRDTCYGGEQKWSHTKKRAFRAWLEESCREVWHQVPIVSATNRCVLSPPPNTQWV